MTNFALLKWYHFESKPALLMRPDVEQTPSAAPLGDLQCCVFLGFVEYDGLNSDKFCSAKVVQLSIKTTTFDANRHAEITLSNPSLGT